MNGPYGIHLLGTAAALFPEPLWLSEYDPDSALGPDGERMPVAPGTYPAAWYIIGTAKPEEAMSFLTTVEAMEEWQRISSVTPLRKDFQPNRPLSAFTVAIERLP